MRLSCLAGQETVVWAAAEEAHVLFFYTPFGSSLSWSENLLNCAVSLWFIPSLCLLLDVKGTSVTLWRLQILISVSSRADSLQETRNETNLTQSKQYVASRLSWKLQALLEKSKLLLRLINQSETNSKTDFGGFHKSTCLSMSSLWLYIALHSHAPMQCTLPLTVSSQMQTRTRWYRRHRCPCLVRAD